MRLAQHEVFGFVEDASIVTEATAVQNVAERGWTKAVHVRIAEARIRLVMAARVPVDPGVVLRGVLIGIAVRYVVVVREIPVRVGQRIEIDNLERFCIQLAGAEDVLLSVAGQQLCATGIGLVERGWLRGTGQRGVQQFGEVARAHQCRGNGLRGGFAKNNAIGLTVPEKEQLVLDDRTADGCAELILAVLGNGERVEVAGIEHVIAEVFPQIAVKAVGAGLDAGIDDRTG